jgi:hypothetical protein
VNLPLKAELIYRFGTQTDAAASLCLQQSRLSRIVRERVRPSKKEMRAFVRLFGAEKTRSLFERRSGESTFSRSMTVAEAS